MFCAKLERLNLPGHLDLTDLGTMCHNSFASIFTNIFLSNFIYIYLLFTKKKKTLAALCGNLKPPGHVFKTSSLFMHSAPWIIKHFVVLQLQTVVLFFLSAYFIKLYYTFYSVL